MGEATLGLDSAGVARLRRFHADGLLYLVNTSVLHPRGFALTLHVDDAGNPTGLSITGDGNEPMCFDADALGNVAERYHASERLRELAWKPPPPPIPTAPPPDIDMGSPLA